MMKLKNFLDMIGQKKKTMGQKGTTTVATA